jgi:hypothetical protein
MDSSYTDLPHTEMPAQLITNISKELKNQVTDVSNINQSINQRPDASALPYTTPDVTAIDGIDSMEPIEIYRSIIRENIEYDSLCERNEYSVDEIKEIVELILETICSSRKVIRIGGEDKPAEYVKSRLLKLEAEHIEYVLDCMGKNTTDVRNIKSYMLTALFNAPATIGNYYRSLVNHDMYGKKGRC